ncbi:MAG: hypothetical protein F6K42_25130 [Leptolyngbya sp. SIO1D8]|nr:hypothetical protein [Leptolyngbya sp. SIO1D8]
MFLVIRDGAYILNLQYISHIEVLENRWEVWMVGDTESSFTLEGDDLENLQAKLQPLILTN